MASRLPSRRQRVHFHWSFDLRIRESYRIGGHFKTGMSDGSMTGCSCQTVRFFWACVHWFWLPCKRDYSVSSCLKSELFCFRCVAFLVQHQGALSETDSKKFRFHSVWGLFEVKCPTLFWFANPPPEKKTIAGTCQPLPGKASV